jgi:hypothetical protein
MLLLRTLTSGRDLPIPASLCFASSPADYGKYMDDQAEKWAKVIKSANIKPE